MTRCQTKRDSHRPKHTRGFTLLEILLVVAAIAILAGIVIVAINPGQQLAEARDAQRRSDVNAIAGAMVQYYIKNGEYPDGFLSPDDSDCGGKDFDSDYGICAEGEDCANGLSLDILVTDEYIAGMPQDPSVEDETYTGYVAFKYQSNRVRVCAPLQEGGDDIFVTR